MEMNPNFSTTDIKSIITSKAISHYIHNCVYTFLQYHGLNFYINYVWWVNVQISASGKLLELDTVKKVIV